MLKRWQVVGAAVLAAGCAHQSVPSSAMHTMATANATWSTPLSSGALMMAGGQCNATHGALRIVRVDGPNGTMTVSCQRPAA